MNLRHSALLLFLFAAVPLLAQPSPERKTGFTFSVGQGDSAVSLRRIVSPQWMVLGTLGFSHGNNGVVGTAANPAPSVTSWSLGAGVRRVFVSEELRPFVEVDAALRRSNLPGCGHINSPLVFAGGGVEYFVARRVSIEGSAGVNYTNLSEHCVSDFGEFRYDAHSFSTFRSALSLTFYF